MEEEGVLKKGEEEEKVLGFGSSFPVRRADVLMFR